MANYKDVEMLKSLLVELEILVNEWNSDDDSEYDYEDIKKRIYDIQDTIRSITEYWEV